MPYRIIRETGMFGVPIYVPQEFSTEDNEWYDLEWGYDEYHREWALTLEAAKRKIIEWKRANKEPNVIWKEQE